MALMKKIRHFLAALALSAAVCCFADSGWQTKSASVQGNADAVNIVLPKPCTSAKKIFALPDDAKFVYIRFDAVCRAFVPDSKGVGIVFAVSFLDAEEKRMRNSGRTERFNADAVKTCAISLPVPSGAVRMQVNCYHVAQNGSAEFRNLKLEFSSRLKSFDAAVPTGETLDELWSLKGAFRKHNPMRETFCLNTLWQFLPVESDKAEQVPPLGSGYGFLRVPAEIPVNPATEIVRHPLQPVLIPANRIVHAWYRREVTPPENWRGRRIMLEFSNLNTRASVWVNGKKCGAVVYPGFPVDLTGALVPGRKNELALLVSADIDEADNFSYWAPDRKIKNTNARLVNRGLNGDVFLSSIPPGTSMTDVRIETSVRKKEILFNCGFARVVPGNYELKTEISDASGIVREFSFDNVKLNSDGRFSVSAKWENPRLWDLDSPENLYTAVFKLYSAEGKPVDVFGPERFGFREFRFEGRDFVLNGKTVRLRPLCVNSTSHTSDKTCDAVVRDQLKRLKSLNCNMFISAVYQLTPGMLAYQDNLYRMAAEEGILCSLTLPHVQSYDVLNSSAAREKYKRDASFYIRRFQNNPAIIMYAVNHNLAGYHGDQNPLKTGTSYVPKTTEPRRMAMATHDIIRSLDPSRPSYSHESGILNGIHTVNCYLNWAPQQERSDWHEFYQLFGKVPLFIVEWGIPHVSSYSSYRGPNFIGRSAENQWANIIEWHASLFGEKSYEISPGMKERLRKETELLKNNGRYRFGWQNALDDAQIQEIYGFMTRENLFAMRRRGVGGVLPWDQNKFFKRVRGKSVSVRNPDRYKFLKQPSPVPDVNHTDGGSFLVSRDPQNWELTPYGRAYVETNADVLCRITGIPGDFSEKGHNFFPGETVAKTLTILNDSRRERLVDWNVRIGSRTERGTVAVKPGDYAEIPAVFRIPANHAPGRLVISAGIKGEGFPSSSDEFFLDILPPPELKTSARIGVYDPEGSALPYLAQLGIPYRTVVFENDLNGLDLLIIGRNALKEKPFALAPYMDSGTKLLILEQPYDVLSKLGFRVQEHGLRTVFPLVEPFGKAMRDWRGESTLLSRCLAGVPYYENGYCRQPWGAFSNSRVWRSGNRGTVAGVIPEKPQNGAFLPLMQGGFNLEYAPVLEYRGRDGYVLLSQLDISGRTAFEPEAFLSFRNLLKRALAYRPETARPLYAAGRAELFALLDALQLPYRKLEAGELPPRNAVLAVDESALNPELADAVSRGLRICAFGLSAGQLNTMFGISSEEGAHFTGFAPGLHEIPEFAGISNSDLYSRAEMKFAAFPAENPGGKTLKVLHRGNGCAVFIQLPPWRFDRKANHLRSTVKHAEALAGRILANLGAVSGFEFSAYLDKRKRVNDNRVLNGRWLGVADPRLKGIARGYMNPEYKPDSLWRPVKVPGAFDTAEMNLEGYDGYFWYRLEFDAPEKKNLTIDLGAVDDESSVYCNGKLVQQINRKTNPADYWKVPRVFTVPASLLRERSNVLTVLCNDLRGNGGIMGVPTIRDGEKNSPAYTQSPFAEDDPYRYYRW